MYQTYDEVNKVNLVVCQTQEEVEKEIAELYDYQLVAYDTETDILETWKCQAYGISFCGSFDKAVYIPNRGIDFTSVKKFLMSDVKKIGHNVKFDNNVIWKNFGIDVNNVVADTMLAHYLLDETRGTHGLKQMFSYYFGLEGDKYLKQLVSTQGSMVDLDETYLVYGKDMVSLKDLGTYGAFDAFMTLKLWKEKLESLLNAENLTSLFNLIVMNGSRILTITERVGVKIDIDLLNEKEKQLIEMGNKLYKSCVEELGHDFSPNSVKDLRKILFEERKLTPIKTGKTGPSTDKASLDELAKTDKVAKNIVHYRKINKLRTAYVEGIKKRMDENGILRSSFWIHGTVSGRYSSKDPNLQAMPKNIRDVFIARPGHKFLIGDYDQMELRVLAHYSQDPVMIDLFKRGVDLHSEVAKWAFHIDCPVEDIKRLYNAQRKKAKAINFGVYYGMSAPSLASQIKSSVEEAQRLLDEYFMRFKKVKELIDSVHEFQKQYEHVVNMFGRKRRLKLSNMPVGVNIGHVYRQGFNALIQGTAADIANLSIVLSDLDMIERGIPHVLVFQTHDEIGFEVPEDRVNEAYEIVSDNAVNCLSYIGKEFYCPLKMDVEIKDRWIDKVDSLFGDDFDAWINEINEDEESEQ